VQRAYESDAQDWHANAAETALMLHLAPKLVHTDRIFDDEDRTANTVFCYTVPQTSKAGHTGTPSKATAQMGAELFEALVTDWTYLVKRALIEKPPLEQSNNKQPPICGPPQKMPAASTRNETTRDEPSKSSNGANLFRPRHQFRRTPDGNNFLSQNGTAPAKPNPITHSCDFRWSSRACAMPWAATSIFTVCPKPRSSRCRIWST
jgi:hypothetical protein